MTPPPSQTRAELEERVARALCSWSLTGLCATRGDEFGCLSRRGKLPCAENCAAPNGALMFSGYPDAARAAIAIVGEACAALADGAAWQDDTDNGAAATGAAVNAAEAIRTLTQEPSA